MKKLLFLPFFIALMSICGGFAAAQTMKMVTFINTGSSTYQTISSAGNFTANDTIYVGADGTGTVKLSASNKLVTTNTMRVQKKLTADAIKGFEEVWIYPNGKLSASRKLAFSNTVSGSLKFLTTHDLPVKKLEIKSGSGLRLGNADNNAYHTFPSPSGKKMLWKSIAYKDKNNNAVTDYFLIKQ